MAGKKCLSGHLRQEDFPHLGGKQRALEPRQVICQLSKKKKTNKQRLAQDKKNFRAACPLFFFFKAQAGIQVFFFLGPPKYWNFQ